MRKSVSAREEGAEARGGEVLRGWPQSVIRARREGQGQEGSGGMHHPEDGQRTLVTLSIQELPEDSSDGIRLLSERLTLLLCGEEVGSQDRGRQS